MQKRGFAAPKPAIGTQLAGSDTAASAAHYVPSWKLAVQSPAIFWRHLPVMAPITLLPALLFTLGTGLVNEFKHIDGWTALGLLVEVLASCLLVLNVSVTIYAQISVIRGRNENLWRIYKRGIRFLPRIIGFLALYSVILAGSIVCLLVPALIMLRRYMLTPYFIVEHRLAIRAAMRRSAAASKPAHGYVWGTLAIIVLLGAANYAIAKLPAPYGTILVALSPSLYIFLPALRYADITANFQKDLRKKNRLASP